MAIETTILTFGGSKVGTVGGNKVMGFVNPILLANPYVWYNNDLATITKTADRVSEWRDSSGNGRHLTQANGGSQPLWVDSLLNGQGGINFDGASTAKFLSTTFSSDLTGVVDVFFVGRMLVSSTFPYYFGSTSDNKRIIQYWFSNEMRLVTTDPSGTAFPAVKTQTLPTGFIFMNPTFDSTNSQYRENRVLLTSSIPLRSCVIDGLRFGAGHGINPDAQTRLNGTIMEFVAYNRKVTDNERIAINDYFMSKYGL